MKRTKGKGSVRQNKREQGKTKKGKQRRQSRTNKGTSK